MAVCESHLESGLARLKREGSDEAGQERTLPAGLPLTVDYRSPECHFVPPAVELYAARHKQEQISSAESSETTTPVKRKRGRPRVDKTSPEYLASLAARKQARESAAEARGAPEPGAKRKRGRPRVDKTSPEYLARKRARELEALERKAKREYKRRSTAGKPMPNNKPTAKQQSSAHNKSLANNNQQNLANNRHTATTKMVPTNKIPSSKGSVNKRALPRVTKRLPPIKSKVATRKLPQKSGKVAPVRKMATKNIAMRRNKFSKVKRKDSGASSSTGDMTPRVKRKYTKRTPSAKKNDGSPATERVKGKRGRPRKADQMNSNRQQQPKIRVRSNLMPMNNEPISLDSDEEPDFGSPSAASDSLSLDENLRALRHIHEKYANIDKDELFEAHLLAAKFKKPPMDGMQRIHDEDVLSIRSSEGGSVKELDTRVEKLEDSSNSDSDSSSSASGSSSSGSSSSSSSCSSDSSDSSDSESDGAADGQNHVNHVDQNSTYSAPAWAAPAWAAPAGSDSEPESDPESARAPAAGAGAGSHDEISESDNESPDKSFQCHICRKWYSTRVTLKIHRRGHQSRGGGASRSRQRTQDRYECDICNQAFPRREKLYAHKAEAHRGAMTFRCEVCRRCFEHDEELAAHADLHTDDERNGRCSECGASFPRFEQLRRHRACAHAARSPARAAGGAAGGAAAGAAAPAHGAALPHACAHCGKRFSHVHSLTRHLHNHAKQLYRCVVCKASFARADQLAQHLNSHLDNYKRLKS